jgi:hypothetical protein
MIITWVTLDPIEGATVEYGTEKLNKIANGTSQIFHDSGLERRTISM